MSKKTEIENIVVVNDFSYTQGGASKVAISTANMLSKEKNVFFFCGDSSGGNELDENVKVISTNQVENLKNKNLIEGARNGIYNNKAYSMLLDLLSKLGGETIVHVHGWTKVLSASIFEAVYDSGKLLVTTLHDYFTVCPNGGFYDHKKDEICELCPMTKKCKKCNCDSRNYLIKMYRVWRQEKQDSIFKKCNSLRDVIVISDFSKEIFKKYLPTGVNYFKIPNPVDCGFGNNVNNINNKSDYYLFVGNLIKGKGPEIFCEAIKKADEKGVVVGDGPEKNELCSRYSNIDFVGWKKKDEVGQYMNKAKALIFPSKWYEVAPLTVIESQSVGTPCIVSSKNAGSEYVEDGKNGLIYDGTVEGLVSAIKTFNAKCDSVDFGAAAKESFTEYAKNDYAKSLLLAYDTIYLRRKSRDK